MDQSSVINISFSSFWKKWFLGYDGFEQSIHVLWLLPDRQFSHPPYESRIIGKWLYFIFGVVVDKRNIGKMCFFWIQEFWWTTLYNSSELRQHLGQLLIYIIWTFLHGSRSGSQTILDCVWPKPGALRGSYKQNVYFWTDHGAGHKQS